MIKHPKIQKESATKICIRLHEMMALLLRFFRNTIQYDKTPENPNWVGHQNTHTSSRNDDPFVTFFRNIIKYDKTTENPKWAGIQNVCTSSRNADPFVYFVKTHFGGWLMTLLLRFPGIWENMIKHSKIQNELATKMCIHLHEMMTLLLHFSGIS